MNNALWNLLARDLSGECSEHDAKCIRETIESERHRRELFGKIESIWELSSECSFEVAETDHNVDDSWAYITSQIDGADGRKLEPRLAPDRDRQKGAGGSSASGQSTTAAATRLRRAKRRGQEATQVLAGVMALVLLLVGTIYLTSPSALGLWGSDESMDYREVFADRGERIVIEMVDGTEVRLNVDSKLRIPRDTEDGRREVFVEGEAYFDVASDPDRPFIVRTANARVNVIGTAFNVRAYSEDGQTDVAVAEGTVSIQPEHSQVESTPIQRGEMGRITPDQLVVTRAADLDVYLGWMDGRIVFDEEPLEQVARRLGRWYNLEYQIEDEEIKSRRLTANLRSQSTRDVLDVVSTALGIDYRLEGGRIIFSVCRRSSQEACGHTLGNQALR